MKRSQRFPVFRCSVLPALALAAAAPSLGGQDAPLDPAAGKTGLLRREAGATEGYTLFTPLSSTTTYLIDLAGEVVHRWESEFEPGQCVHLLPSGNLLRSGRSPANRTFHAGGEGGVVQELAWDGTVVWQYSYTSEEHLQHHDVEPLPNGNVLLIAWERKTAEQALAAGRDPALLEAGELWVDHLVEVRPIRPAGGEIVWEWHVWDHLVQDRDAAKPGYGEVARHPELVDLNADRWRARRTDEELDEEQRRLRGLGYVGGPPADGPGGPGGRGRADWNHTNSVRYNATLDLIVLSVHSFSEIWVIDHGTTREEAAGHQGGRRGHGGDLLYRWGNPKAWGAGSIENRRLFAQHDARWVQDGDGGWSVLVFNNGPGRPDGEYSSVDQIRLPFDPEGGFRRADGEAFGPPVASWTYTAPKRGLFFASHISGAERLANGNTLIASGEEGRIFEVTSAGETVWEYLNPFRELPRRGPDGAGPPDRRPGGGRRGPGGMGGPGGRGGRGGGPGLAGALFRATRLAPDHPGLARLREAAAPASAGESG
ncbi:MAG: aryl-sulfate sulfotransferase [Planctomycetota bacterium]